MKARIQELTDRDTNNVNFIGSLRDEVRQLRQQMADNERLQSELDIDIKQTPTITAETSQIRQAIDSEAPAFEVGKRLNMTATTWFVREGLARQSLQPTFDELRQRLEATEAELKSAQA